MILSNVEIQHALDQGRLVIDPEPAPRTPPMQPGDPDCPYDTHSVDLRLGDFVRVPSAGQITFDLTKEGSVSETIAKYSVSKSITVEQPFALKPHQFVLANTRERIQLPICDQSENCLAARIEGKSSFARLGLLVHFTAPTVHPGFEGTLTLEIINLGANAIALSPGMYIAQLIVEEVKGVPFRNPSQFQGQVKPEG